jgi:hypothetical protein
MLPVFGGLSRRFLRDFAVWVGSLPITLIIPPT